MIRPVDRRGGDRPCVERETPGTNVDNVDALVLVVGCEREKLAEKLHARTSGCSGLRACSVEATHRHMM